MLADQAPQLEERLKRRRAFGIGWLIVLLVVGIALIWSFTYKLGYYAITPGLSQPVGPLITVHDHAHAPARDNILLTDVYLTQLNVWQWLAAEIHPVHEQIIPASYLTGGNVPTSQLQAMSYLEMYDSQNTAKAVGMRALGLHVGAVPAGVTVVAVASNSPASSLQVADRIVAARGRAVTSSCGLLSALSGTVPGQSVSLRVEPAHITASGTITYGAARSMTVGTAAPSERTAVTACPGAPVQTAVLGIAPEDATTYHFPVSVTIDTAYIGGPSAGLAMTLGVMDALSKVSITGTTKVAATGEINASGVIGDVGGVAEKTIAVEQAGATVFLVPTVEVGVAKAAASPGLRVVGVRTLQQALRAIKAFGGTEPVVLTDTTTAGATS